MNINFNAPQLDININSRSVGMNIATPGAVTSDFDAILRMDTADYSMTLLKGSYASVRPKVLNGTAMIHVLIAYETGVGHKAVSTGTFVQIFAEETYLYVVFTFGHDSEETAWFIWNEDDTFSYDE